MKKLATGLMSLSLLCLLSAAALANHRDLKEHITVSNKIWVNGTKIKPGNYTVRYDNASGQMTLSKNGKVVVRSAATVTTNIEKFDHDAILTHDTLNGAELTSIRLGGQREEIQLSEVASDVSAFLFVFPDAILNDTNMNITDVDETLKNNGVTEGGDVPLDPYDQ